MNRTSYYQKNLRRILNGVGVMLLLALFTHSLQSQTRSRVGEYEISGPYHHKTLTLFLIHGKSLPHTMPFLTLEEALEQGLVKVYETGNVNELAIENLSPDHEVFIQAGEIVKGGRQDRTLGVDLSLAPNSGKIPIASFCVERGRWSKRGDEEDGVFSKSDNMVTSNSLRLAVKKAKNQSEVWSEVSVVQNKLSDNLGVKVNALDNGSEGNLVLSRAVEPLANVGSNRIVVQDAIAQNAVAVENRVALQQTNQEVQDIIFNTNTVDLQVQSLPANRIIGEANIFQSYDNSMANGGDAYTTSLQLSLENEKLTEEINAYVEALRDVISGQGDVIGFAFTINGKMKNADIYASSELFGRLWPKLLRAAATEAVAEKGEEEIVGRLQVVEDCLIEAGNATAEEEEVSDRIKMVTRESKEHILFETQDSENENGWVHRNYMKLE
ncbi:MAG: DUF6569 family protein [Candidatus Kapaibacterium sp.]